MTPGRRFFLVGACALSGLLLAALLVFEFVFVGSGSCTPTLRFHANGKIEVLGRASWTGREGNWLYWTSDGKIDRERSGRFHVGFRYAPVDEDEAEEYTHGVSRLQIDLSVLADWIRRSMGAHAGKYPDSLESALGDTNGIDASRGIRSVPKDPWGHEYRYVANPDAHTFALFTFGRDEKRGGSGPDSDYALFTESGQSRFSTTAP